MNQAKKIALNNPLIPPRRQATGVALFWYGFLVFTVANVFLLTGNEYLNGAACQGIQLVALIVMITGLSSIIRWKFDDKYLETVFTIFFIYQLTVVARGIKFDYNYLKNLLLDGGFGILPYVAPILVLLPRNIGVYKKASGILVIFGMLYLLFDSIYYSILTNPDWYNQDSLQYVEILVGAFGLPVSFLLLTFAYQKKVVNIFAIIVALTEVYFLLYRARRGSLSVVLFLLIAAGLVYLIYTKRTALVIFISTVGVLVGTVLFSGIKLPGMLTFIMARKDEDTRTGVEQWMYASMTPKFWIIGKGLDGKYYCPTVINLVDNSYDRPVIETGYLQIILKGGIINLVLLLMILIPAVYYGLFKSGNVLAKGAAMFILIWMASLYPGIPTVFTMTYVLLWISVGICYSKQVRELSDIAIKAHFRRLK